MSYKTVLAYFGLAARGSGLMDIAFNFARRHEAHLIGLAVVPPVHMYAALAGEVSDQLINLQRRAFRAEAEAIGSEFEERARREEVAAEWRCVDSGPLGIADEVVRQAANADIVLTRQGRAEDAWELLPPVPERLLMDCRRPVLLVPNAGHQGPVGSHVLVGWNGRNEGARAAFDAVPILQKAEHVEVVTVDDPAHDGADGFTPADGIAASLARHEIDVETLVISSDGQSEGEALLRRAHDQGCDLLVVGGYGHSRVSQFIFGGVTRHVLRNMTLPVFMSH